MAGLDRCRKYQPQVLREARYHLGLDAPAALFLGQIEQESGCDAGVTAFDGGMGLGQFMPATAREVHAREAALRALGAEPLPYDPRWSIRALILYDAWLYDRVACPGWPLTFRAYNGGLGTLNREIARAGSCEEEAVARACRRKILRLPSGKTLDLCRVNLEYPQQIARRAESYRRGGE